MQHFWTDQIFEKFFFFFKFGFIRYYNEVVQEFIIFNKFCYLVLLTNFGPCNIPHHQQIIILDKTNIVLLIYFKQFHLFFRINICLRNVPYKKTFFTKYYIICTKENEYSIFSAIFLQEIMKDLTFFQQRFTDSKVYKNSAA